MNFLADIHAWLQRPENFKWIVASIFIPILTVVILVVYTPSIVYTPSAEKRLSISGRLVASGEPIVDETISLHDAAGKIAESRTDSKGKFRFDELISGDYYLYANQDVRRGLTAINTKLSNGSIYIPIDVNGLAELTFVADAAASIALFLDKQEMATILNTDGKRIIHGIATVVHTGETAQNIFLVTKGQHTYSYYEIESADRKPKEQFARFSNVFNQKQPEEEESEENDVQYRIVQEIETITRDFVGPESIYLKTIAFPLASSDVNQTSDDGSKVMKHSVSIRTTGYRWHKLDAIIRFQRPDKTLVETTESPFSVDGNLGLRKTVSIESNFQNTEILFEIPHRAFPDTGPFLVEAIVKDENRILAHWIYGVVFFTSSESNSYEAGINMITLEKDESEEIARAYLLQNRFSEADAILQERIKANDKSEIGWFLLAYSMYRQKKYEEAEAAATKGLQLNPEHEMMKRIAEKTRDILKRAKR